MKLSDEYIKHLLLRSREKGHFFVSTSDIWVEDDKSKLAEVIRDVLAPLTRDCSLAFSFGSARGDSSPKIKKDGRRDAFEWSPSVVGGLTEFLAASGGKRPAVAWQIQPETELLGASLAHCADPFVLENVGSVIPRSLQRFAMSQPELILVATSNNGLQWLGFLGDPTKVHAALTLAIQHCRITGSLGV